MTFTVINFTVIFQQLKASTVLLICLFLCFLLIHPAVPAPAVSAAALGCVPPPVRKKVDPRRLQVLQQPEVDTLTMSFCRRAQTYDATFVKKKSKQHNWRIPVEV